MKLDRWWVHTGIWVSKKGSKTIIVDHFQLERVEGGKYRWVAVGSYADHERMRLSAKSLRKRYYRVDGLGYRTKGNG